jgi:LCP family protein required for cell wall assembly
MSSAAREPAPHSDDGEPRPARVGFGRFLGLAILGSFVPGTGLIAAGRRVSGWIMVGAWAGLVAGVLIGVLRAGQSGLMAIASDPSSLRTLGSILIAVAALWVLAAVVSLYHLQPPTLNAWQRLAGAVAVATATSLVLAPMGLATQYSRTHTELIDRVFASGEQRSLTGPTAPPDTANPWDGRPRVNVLLLGSDAAEGRDGARPDTIIVASVDTETGDTVLLSLPRNLQRIPFPEESPLHELYPNGFTGAGDRNNWLLNAVYQNVPADHPEVFAGSSYPGADATKWAVEGVLDLDIDYFAMVNLDGFQELIDALGGITVNVNYRIPIGTRLNEQTGHCTAARAWIEPEQNKRLDGPRALWFARARCGPYPVTDDYNRMERQRCVIGAIIDEARPMTLLRQYQRLAGAAGEMFVTDVPQTLLPAFVDLAMKVQNAQVVTLAFTDEVLQSSNPDYERIHELVAEALAPQPAEPVQSSGTAATSAPGAPATPTMTATPAADDGTTDETDEASGEPTAQPIDAVC